MKSTATTVGDDDEDAAAHRQATTLTCWRLLRHKDGRSKCRVGNCWNANKREQQTSRIGLS